MNVLVKHLIPQLILVNQIVNFVPIKMIKIFVNMAMTNLDKKLTSAYVDKELLDEFKTLSSKYKFNIQKLFERSMDLYIKNEEVRRTLHNHRLGN
jgi:hypothetical protein